MVRQAAAEVVGKVQADTRLATDNGFALSCVREEARELIINGKKDWTDLVHEKVGEIKAQIIERDGQVWMVKECPIHGKYEDLMAIDAKFLEWIEGNFPGRDIPAHNDEELTTTDRARFVTAAAQCSPWT